MYSVEGINFRQLSVETLIHPALDIEPAIAEHVFTELSIQDHACAVGVANRILDVYGPNPSHPYLIGSASEIILVSDTQRARSWFSEFHNSRYSAALEQISKQLD